MSPYQFVYGMACHLSVELKHRAHWAIRNWNMDFMEAGHHRKMQLSEIEEWRDKAYHSAKIYKERTKRCHDRWIKHKEFKAGDKVLLFNSRVKLFGHGKLRSKWMGPYTIVDASSHGAVTLRDNEGNIFMVNGHHLKVFLDPLDVDRDLDVVNLVAFSCYSESFNPPWSPSPPFFPWKKI